MTWFSLWEINKQMASELKPTPKKRKRKSERKKLVEALDTIVSLIVRARDKACVLCGTRENLTNGHLWSRSSYSTRWYLLNCHCQCSSCNLSHEYDSYPFQEWFRLNYGDKAYHELYIKYKRSVKLSDGEMRQMLEEFKDMYQNHMPPTPKYKRLKLPNFKSP